MVHGEYNKKLYVVYRDGEEVYRAGNSPFDSQGYVPVEQGVSLNTMRKFCYVSTLELTDDIDEYKGVQYNPNLE